MEISVCPLCRTRVALTSSGECPACRQNLTNSQSDTPNQVVRTEPNSHIGFSESSDSFPRRLAIGLSVVLSIVALLTFPGIAVMFAAFMLLAWGYFWLIRKIL